MGYVFHIKRVIFSEHNKLKFIINIKNYLGLIKNRGFNEEGIHKRTGTLFDEDGYNKEGFDKDGLHKDTRIIFDKKGFDNRGFEKYEDKDLKTIIIKDILEEAPPTFPYDTPKTWIRPILQIKNSCVLVTKDNKITGIVNAWDYLSKI